MNPGSTHIHDSISENTQPDRSHALDRDRLMAEFSIVQYGRYYWCEGYRYERLEDALAYVQVVRARKSRPAPPSLSTRFEVVESPNASDRQLMIELSITFENGRFSFEGFHYDRFIDAANYARLRRDSAMK